MAHPFIVSSLAATVAVSIAGCTATDPVTPPPPPVPATIAWPAPAVAAPLVAYTVPVIAPVRDGFRLPATLYGAGNRGLEYATAPGQSVSAAGPGVVVFAGAIGATRAVSIDHADGLRTTYTHLLRIDVVAGASVGPGEVIGSASDRLHFGARLGSAYLDPTGLFESGWGQTRLVPDPDLERRGRPIGD